MGFVRTKGIVVKEVETGEADRYVTIFTDVLGKISIYVRGLRRMKSRFAAPAQLLCYSEFVLFQNRGRFSINSAEVIEPFYNLRNDVVTLTYASHFLEIVNDVVQEDQPMPELLRLFLNCLHMLTRPDKDPLLISSIFELKTLSMLGYAPGLDNCAICGCKTTAGATFSFIKCGLICNSVKCREGDRFAAGITDDAANVLKYIINSRMEDLFRLGSSPNVLAELRYIIKRYMRERLEKDYNKLDFLRRLV